MYINAMRDYPGHGLNVSNQAGDPTELVVPRYAALFECRDVSYRKVRFKSTERLTQFLDEASALSSTPFGTPHADSFAEVGEEFVLLELASEGRYDVHLLWGPCVVYIMSNSGKTIDTIRCS
jgi:hypothetical protein